jgi:Flp pilus assembly protein TadD
LHVSCPDGKKTSRFIVTSTGETSKVTSEDDLSSPAAAMDAAELRTKLHEHIQEAIRLRARGRMDEAAEQLRDARRLDPDNSDLHRELGITFLLGKDWKRARIEMLEAIHSDPTDAEAYNGLGYALEKMGMIDAAVEAFHIATRLEPSDTSYRRQYFEAIGRQAEQRAAQKKR